VRVYNMLGQQVADLVNQSLPAGSHSLDWNAAAPAQRHVPAGADSRHGISDRINCCW
jgi:hypothetical protein